MKVSLVVLLMVFNSLVGANQEHEIVGKVQGIIEATHAPEFQEVWPGFDFSSQATLVTFKNGHLYALDFKSDQPMWEKESIGKGQVLYSSKDSLAASQFPFQPHFDLEGSKAYAFSMEPVVKGDPNAYHVFVHERFHTYQFQHFHKQKQGHYQDQWNGENLTLVKMEEKALLQFLKGEKSKRKGYLYDFLAIHQMRQALIHPESIRLEGHEQTMEGLAEYVSFKLFDTFPELQIADGKEKLIRLLENYEGNPQVAERVVKWRHYGVGAALAYALDELEVKDWKKLVEKEGVPLVDILQAALPMSGAEAEERFQFYVLSAYDYEENKAAVEQGVKQYHQAVENTLKNFEEREGIVVSIAAPRVVALSGKGSTDRQVSLPNGTQVSLRDTSTFATADQNWKLELKDHPQVFQTYFGAREFKCGTDAVVWLDGKQVSLSEIARWGQERKGFDSLKIEAKGTLFESAVHHGEIYVDLDGAVVIEYP